MLEDIVEHEKYVGEDLYMYICVINKPGKYSYNHFWFQKGDIWVQIKCFSPSLTHFLSQCQVSEFKIQRYPCIAVMSDLLFSIYRWMKKTPK